jgi:hypothetical protein
VAGNNIELIKENPFGIEENPQVIKGFLEAYRGALFFSL